MVGLTAACIVTADAARSRRVEVITGVKTGLAAGAMAVGSTTRAVRTGASVAGGALTGALSSSMMSAATAGPFEAVASVAANTVVGGLSGAAVPSAWAGVITGPIGWVVLGTNVSSNAYTWDCWKGILHDTSSEPSKGKLFRDVVTDDRVKTVYSSQANGASHMIVENIWDESFRIDPVVLPWNELALHASRLV